MKEQNQPWPKRAKNEWVIRCETEMFLRNSSTNFTLSSSPGASVLYAGLCIIRFVVQGMQCIYCHNKSPKTNIDLSIRLLPN